MTTTNKLVNRVANSRLKIINLEDFFPKEEIVEFDLKDFLFKELVLREKEYRDALETHNWEAYQDKLVALHCSTDAILPTWAFMLAASYLQPYAKDVYFGSKAALLEKHFQNQIKEMDIEKYEDELIVIKGCSKNEVPTGAYVQLTSALRPRARSIMFGEACSAVPIYRKPRKRR